MSTLATRQREFARSLLDDAPADAGVAVYRASVAANFSAALAATYPVVRRLVGEAFFAEAARRFVLSHASASGDLTEYGAGFPAFLAAYPHASALEYLPDVARLEWACHECESSPDAAGFD
ncbi:MAG TPA: DNA-binding domain-containing protein, partial [Usitatibacter sp.]|nr:DNA-binding domain-containing protein [Usitatibacter sp.]